MTEHDIFDALGGVNADAVLAAAPEGAKGKKNLRKPHKHGWIKWVVIAACLSLLVTTVFAATAEFKPFIEKPDDNKDKEISADDALVVALVEYMNELEVDHDMPAITTADKMDAIRDGQQALHVAFDSSKPYFVCAYSADGQQSGEYTWLKYANVGDITKEYEDLQMALAFQINPSLFVKDIMTEDAAVPSMEHFQPYEPQFNEGLNTKAADTFDETFIYLNSSEENAVYYSTTAYDHEWVTVPCTYYKDKYYVSRPCYTLSLDGKRVEIDTYTDLREHYLAIETQTPRYKEVANEDGVIIGFGLTKIEDFAIAITVTEENNKELSNFFDYMVNETITTDKIEFTIIDQRRSYFDRQRDQTDSDYWVSPRFWIVVHIDYSLATDEEWYKACENTELITLKTAFYDKCCSDLLAERPYIGIGGREIDIIYRHADEHCTDQPPLSEVLIDVYHDYEIIKNLAELDYVTSVEVIYWYSFYED